MLYTTYNLAQKANACSSSLDKMIQALGSVETYGADTPTPLTKILEICGLDDALWTLRCTTDDKEAKRISLLFGAECAEHVLPNYEKAFPNDRRVRDCIATVRRFANGQATEKELAGAYSAARSAAWSAEEAASWSVWSVAWSARAAAWTAGAEIEYQKRVFTRLLEKGE